MGNRGPCLHNDQLEIVRQFVGKRWLICVLQFKNRQRVVMSPGLYTELFFLDEAVALAAGHRPCAECRRDRFNAFRGAWLRNSGADPARPLLAPEMDAELHTARINTARNKVTYEEKLDSLPDGSFVRIDDSAYLVQSGALLLWTPNGYVKKEQRPSHLTVSVLTPQPTVRCLQRGYQPEIHHSARTL